VGSDRSHQSWAAARNASCQFAADGPPPVVAPHRGNTIGNLLMQALGRGNIAADQRADRPRSFRWKTTSLPRPRWWDARMRAWWVCAPNLGRAEFDVLPEPILCRKTGSRAITGAHGTVDDETLPSK